MDRLAPRALAIAVAALIVCSYSAHGGDPKPGKPRDARSGEPAGNKPGYRLGEVQILGSAEHPQVLFFLPRAKFRLLPLRDNRDWKKSIVLDDKGKREAPE